MVTVKSPIINGPSSWSMKRPSITQYGLPPLRGAFIGGFSVFLCAFLNVYAFFSCLFWFSINFWGKTYILSEFWIGRLISFLLFFFQGLLYFLFYGLPILKVRIQQKLLYYNWLKKHTSILTTLIYIVIILASEVLIISGGKTLYFYTKVSFHMWDAITQHCFCEYFIKYVTTHS